MDTTIINDQLQILKIINANYPLQFDNIEFLRDSGCYAYAIYSNGCKYFLRVTKPMFFDTATKSLDIHLFLQKQGFSVPKIIYTKDHLPYIQIQDEDGDHYYVVYEYIEGEAVEPEQDAEIIGAFIGQLHNTMKEYPGELINQDRYYYVDRYINIMHAKQYSNVDKFIAYGDALWERVKDLPRGYCHGDMYKGNILKTSDNRLFLLDFDTSCEGFPMYDPTLICTINDYFDLEDDGYIKSKNVFERFLPEYLKYNSLSKAEIAAFYDLIALYHFALQATIIEIFGLDCVDNDFLDRQLHWLYKWQDLCKQNSERLILQTDDLTLKTVSTEDINEVARMWHYPDETISYSEAQEAINYMCNNHQQNKIGQIYHLCFAVFEKTDSDRIIGWCGIDGKSYPGETVLFYSIEEPYRNRGYATQCARALIKYVFEVAKIEALNGGCYKDNVASYKVMEKAGMIQHMYGDNGDPLFYIDQKIYWNDAQL